MEGWWAERKWRDAELKAEIVFKASLVDKYPTDSIFLAVCALQRGGEMELRFDMV